MKKITKHIILFFSILLLATNMAIANTSTGTAADGWTISCDNNGPMADGKDATTITLSRVSGNNVSNKVLIAGNDIALIDVSTGSSISTKPTPDDLYNVYDGDQYGWFDCASDSCSVKLTSTTAFGGNKKVYYPVNDPDNFSGYDSDSMIQLSIPFASLTPNYENSNTVLENSNNSDQTANINSNSTVTANTNVSATIASTSLNDNFNTTASQISDDIEKYNEIINIDIFKNKSIYLLSGTLIILIGILIYLNRRKHENQKSDNFKVENN
ncbi:MAG: hypothetical protein WCW17_04030 [Patescibacteria group bacterium]|jgi:hypothetical protein